MYSAVILPAVLAVASAAVWNADNRYGNWLRYPQDGAITRIPVYIEAARYQAEPNTINNINSAIANMNAGLASCLQFYTVPSPSFLGRDFIWVSTGYNNGTVSPTCSSVPGRQFTQQGNGQKLMLVSSTTLGGRTAGSCADNVRQIMAKFANTLGLRNEYQRTDRPFGADATKVDSSIGVYGADMYKTYASTAAVNMGTFDPQSITMIPGTVNAASGSNIFVGNQPAVPTTASLSSLDQQAITCRYCGQNCQTFPGSG